MSVTAMAQSGGAVLQRPEMRLLLAAARVRLESRDERAIAELVESGLDWTFVVQLARRHKVVPLLQRSLTRVCKDRVPTAVAQELQALYAHHVATNMLLASFLPRLIASLEAQQIRVIPFKGLDVAIRVYGNLSLRHVGDVDLFAAEHDYQRAIDVLSGLGYRQISDHGWETVLVDSSGRVKVDLHRAISPPELEIGIDFARWRERAARMDLGGGSVPTLSLEDLLIVLCIQIAKDGWAGRCELKKICDVAELVSSDPTFDFDSTIAAAEQIGCRRALYLGLKAARDLRGVQLPAQVSARVDEEPEMPALFQHLCDGFATNAGERTVTTDAMERFALQLRERWRDRMRPRVRRMRQMTTPNERDRSIVALPSRLEAVYFLIRPLRLLTSAISRFVTGSRASVD
jgi:hypothetical protein